MNEKNESATEPRDDKPWNGFRRAKRPYSLKYRGAFWQPESDGDQIGSSLGVAVDIVPLMWSA